MLNEPSLQHRKYEISGMPIGDIIEMVAALLTKITTTNDMQHDAISRNASHQQQANLSGDASSQMSPLSHSVLAFHGKNVPAITIFSYLSRIHKYCPTTFEVFLSLLVYFDRMTERVNDMATKSEEAKKQGLGEDVDSPDLAAPTTADVPMHENGDSEASDETDSDLVDTDDSDIASTTGSVQPVKIIVAADRRPVPTATPTYFVVDSFNIHRLVIAGVTGASKFFSDVFYTNSRYAKVISTPSSERNTDY